MRSSVASIPVLLCVSLIACNRAPAPEAPPPESLLTPDTGENRLVAPTKSVFDLYRLVAQDPKNVTLSPLSLKLAFGLLHPGASQGTRDSLDALFGFDKNRPSIVPAEFELLDATRKNQKSFEFSITNSVWLKDPKQIHPHYQKALTPLRAEVRRLQLKDLNDWVEKATSGKISRLLDQIRPGTLAVALNTVYLRALWVHPFAKERTIQGRFQPSEHATKVVPLMQQKARFRYREDRTSRWVELPYRDTPLVMVVGLPKKRFDLKTVESRVGPELLSEMKSDWKERQVDLVLPRFSVGLKQSLQPLMKTAGFGNLFGKGAFPKVLKSGDLTASEVLQAVSVEVREEGTEAAAATAVTLERSALFDGSSVPFYADEPFVFLLMNRESGELYFIGRVFDPTQG